MAAPQRGAGQRVELQLIFPFLLAFQALSQGTAAPSPPAATGVASVPATSPATAKAYLKAHDLLERCTKWSSGPDYCYGYIVSAYDTARAYQAWLNLHDLCVPAGLTQGELVKSVTDYFYAHPSDLDAEAASLVIVALQRSFPCPPAIVTVPQQVPSTP